MNLHSHRRATRQSHGLHGLNASMLSLAVIAISAVTGSSVALAEEPSPIANMRLLDGYAHRPLQGIDSIVGEIAKAGELKIVYEKGRVPKPGGFRLGGDFTDRAKNSPADQRRWYREQVSQGNPVHIAMLKSGRLVASFPTIGMNFSAEIKSDDQLADALLMIMTFPGAKK